MCVGVGVGVGVSVSVGVTECGWMRKLRHTTYMSGCECVGTLVCVDVWMCGYECVDVCVYERVLTTTIFTF